MALDKLVQVFETKGLREGIKNFRTLIQVMKEASISFKGTSINKLSSAIDQTGRSLGLTGRQFDNFKAKAEDAVSSYDKLIKLKQKDKNLSFSRRDLSKETYAAAKAQVDSELRAREDAYAKSKPIVTNITPDFIRTGPEKDLKKSAIDINSIKDENVRIKTQKELLSLISKEQKKIEESNVPLKEKESYYKRIRALLQGMKTSTVDLQDPTKGHSDAYKKQAIALNSSVRDQSKYNAGLIETNKSEQQASKQKSEIANKQKGFNDSIGTAIGKLIKYRIAFFAMRGAIESVKSSISEFTELQYSLANLEIVIDRSTDSISEYKNEAIRLSQAFGLTAKEIVDSQKIWAQMGLEQEAVIKATESTLIGVNALGMSVGQVTESLTAAIFTYGIEVENVTNVISKWLSVQREFPISAQDLANSLKVVGAAAKVVGVDLDDLAGYVAAIGSITRKSGAAVGQSLKTMFARLPRKNVVQVFESLDIAVLKNASELRDLDNVLAGLSEKWEDLNSVEKANLAVTIGGIRRYADFIALMDNYDVKVKASIESRKASNEAEEASALVMATFKKEVAQTKATIAEFSMAVGQKLAGPLQILNNGLKYLVGVMNGAKGTFASLTAGIIAAVTIFGVLGIAIFTVNFALQKITGLASSVSSKFTELGATSQVASVGVSRLSASTGFLSRAFIALRTSMGGFVAIAGIIAAVAAVFGGLWAASSSGASDASSAMGEFSKETSESVDESNKRIKVLQEEIKFTDKLKNNISNLNDKLQDTETGSPEQTDYIDKIIEKLDLLPKTEGDVQLAVLKTIDSLEAKKKITDSLIPSINNYRDSLISASEKEKEANKDLVDSELERIKVAKLRIASDAEEVESAKAKFKELEKQQVDFIKSFEKIEGGLPQVGSYPGARFVWQDEIKKQAKTTVESYIDLYAEEVERLPKELREKFNIETGTIFDDPEIVDRAEESFERIIKNVNDRIKEKKLTEEESAIEIKKRLDLEIKSFLVEDLGYSKELSEVLVELVKRREDLIEQEKKLKGEKPLDDTLFVGRKPTEDVISLSVAFKKLVNEYDHTIDRFKITKDLLDFGKVLEYEESNKKALITAIQGIGNEFVNTKIKLAEYTEELEALEKIQKILTGEGKEYVTDEGIAKSVDDAKHLGVLLGDLPEAYTQNILGSEKPLSELGKRLEDVKNTIAALEKAGKDKGRIKQYEDYVSQLNVIIAKEKERYLNTLAMKEAFDPVTKQFENQSKVLSYLRETELDIIDIEKRKADFQLEYERSLATELIGQEKRDALLRAEESHHKSIASLLERERNVSLDKIMKEVAENAGVFKEALSGAFEDIPKDILGNSEKRRDLQNDMREAELDLQEARKDGDKQSIVDAQHRVDLIKHEMKEYKRGWAEIRDTVTNIFGSISSAWWKKLSDQVAQNLADVTIGGVTIGNSVGDAITRTTTEFINNWRIYTTDINKTFLTKYRDLLSNHVTQMAEIMEVPDPGVLYGSNLDIIGPTPLYGEGSYDKEMIDSTKKLTDSQKALRSTFILVGSTIATSIAGTGGVGSNTGSQIGSMFGTKIAEQKLSESLGAAGYLAGPIGSLVGGLFGGLVGGLFDKDRDEPEKPLITSLDNLTEATLQNTIALKELDKAIFNAPTRFNVPSYSGSFGGSVVVNINSNSPQDIKDEVSRAIDDAFESQGRTYGTRGYVPI